MISFFMSVSSVTIDSLFFSRFGTARVRGIGELDREINKQDVGKRLFPKGVNFHKTRRTGR